MRRRRAGYIMVETIVAMGLLSVSIVVIQNAIRQGIITRGQAQDYTTARILLDRMVAEHELQPEVAEGSGEGQFEAPFHRFSYKWNLQRLKVPRPHFPTDMEESERDSLKRMFTGYMGKLYVEIRWSRAGFENYVVGETLLAPEHIWIPADERMEW